MHITFRNLTTQVAEGSLQMTKDKMFVEIFRLDHHGQVLGYGDGVTPTEIWGSTKSTIVTLSSN